MSRSLGRCLSSCWMGCSCFTRGSTLGAGLPWWSPMQTSAQRVCFLRKFKEVRRRVQLALAHGFGRLCFTQNAQTFHILRRLKQEKRLFQCANILCPCGRFLVLARRQ